MNKFSEILEKWGNNMKLVTLTMILSTTAAFFFILWATTAPAELWWLYLILFCIVFSTFFFSLFHIIRTMKERKINIKKAMRFNGSITDKQAHALYGLLFFISFWIAWNIDVAIILVILLAAAIEFVDSRTRKGKAELADFIYTITIPATIYLLNFLF